MDIVYSFKLILMYLLGTLMGSFYGVVGYRRGKGEDFVKGRSYCNNCKHLLKWYDLIPIISYLTLKGKCRYCHKKISPVLPFVELTTGLLFVIAFYSFSNIFDLLVCIFIISLLMIVIVSDLEYYIIPDEVLIFFIVCFIILQLFRVGFIETLIHIGTGLFLFFVMYGILLLGNYLFKKESMGGGDVKLLFIFGLVLDPLIGLFTIFLASFIALPVSFYLYITNKNKIIPFGPFLIIAFLIMYFTKITTPDILTFLQI